MTRRKSSLLQNCIEVNGQSKAPLYNHGQKNFTFHVKINSAEIDQNE